jgi:hypothetical protein
MSTTTPQRKRAAVAAAATVAVGAGAAPLLFPAGATAYGRTDCQDNRLCLFSDGGFQNNLSQRQVTYDITCTSEGRRTAPPMAARWSGEQYGCSM